MKSRSKNKFLCGIVVFVLMVVLPASGGQGAGRISNIEQGISNLEGKEKKEEKESQAEKDKPEAGETAKEKPKKRRVIEFDFEKAGLEKTAAEQMKYFLQVPALVRKINVAGKKGRPGKAPRKKIAALLVKAAAIAADDSQKEYLKNLAGGIISENFSDSASKWLAQPEQKVDIIIRSKKRKKKRRLEVYILWYRPEVGGGTKARAVAKSGEGSEKVSSGVENSPQRASFFPNSSIKKYTAILDKLLDNIPINETLAPVNSAAVNPIVVVDVIFAPVVSGYALVYPGISAEGAPGKFKTLIFRNRLEAYFKKSVLPLAARALTPKWAKAVDFDSYLSNRMMHRLSHYLGPVLVETGDDEIVTVKSKLKDVFFLLEELRADTAAIAGTSVLLEEELITPEQEKGIYSTHLVSLLALLLSDPGKDITKCAILQVNQLLKKGGIIFDLNSKKLEIEPKLYGGALKRLMLTAAQVELSGDYAEAKLFIDGKGSSPGNELSEVLKNLEKKPRRVRRVRKRRKKAAAPVSKETSPEKKENK
ncbi:MAG: hypothetical protein KAW12_11735 [Candidatus Aminicenantes bacterium]|nr:hypothetical protein [Candidatus Aminicenantes bacterium]